MNKPLRRISMGLAVLLTFFAVFMMPGAAREAMGATSLAQLQQKQKDLKTEQAQLDVRLKDLKTRQADQEEYQQTLNQKIANAQSQIDTLKELIAGLDQQIEEKSSEIRDTELQIDENFQILRRRLKAIYLSGEASQLDILFSADNVTEFFNRANFVQAIADHDHRIISSLRELREGIQSEKTGLETDRAEVTEAKTEYEQQQQELESALAESKRLEQQLKESQAAAERRQQEINAAFAQVDKEIEAWWKEYYRQKAEQAARAQAVSTGSFTWPMPGYARRSNLTQYFGGANAHRGIDIAGAGIYGKTIVAADAGIVAMTSYNDYVYGIYLQIDHGNGVATLYGHTSGLLVRAGQVVRKGQPIAYVGNSGISRGAHLHFGVLIRGVPVNPLNYFRLS